jgi:acyl carrier protein
MMGGRMTQTKATESAIIAEVRKFVMDLQPDFDREIALSSTFEEMELDSLSEVDLLGVLEQAFDVYVPDSEIDGINTVGDLVRIIVGLSEQA